MKAQTNSAPNKKLILHFDIAQVLTLPTFNPDLYVYECCSEWLWGKIEKNAKDDPQKVTGWKIANNSLSVECPDAELITYKQYVEEYVKPSPEQYEKLMLNLSKGPGAKAKAEIQKNIKNITLPKTLAEVIKENVKPNDKLLNHYAKTGKYQILPSFFKLLLSLKKNKRQFAIHVKASTKDNHSQVLTELNRFFSGEHPLYNGQNGTPAIKWDGSKGTHNYIVEESHQSVFYWLGDELFATFGTLSVAEEKDPEMFKQKYKSIKQVKLCQGTQEIYATSHALLSQSACIYEINPLRAVILDPNDYLTHEIYFTNSDQVDIYSCLGPKIQDCRSFVVRVRLFDYLKDVDYFIKNVEQMEHIRNGEINRIEKGEVQQEQPQEAIAAEANQLNNYQYLKKNLLPVLEGALRQVDLFRPEDPLSFIALYCLKNRDKLE